MSRNEEIKNLIKEITEYYDDEPGEEVTITLTQEGHKEGLPGKVFTFSDPKIIDSLVKEGLFKPKPPRLHPRYVQPGTDNILVFEGVFFLKKAGIRPGKFDRSETSRPSADNLLDKIPDNKKNKVPRKMVRLFSTEQHVSDFNLSRCFETNLTRRDYSDDHKKYAELVLNRLKTVKKYLKHDVQISREKVPTPGYIMKRLQSN